MEVLRFGSSIPGAYWGCCAACIIQDFNCDPDAQTSIEVVCGDNGSPISFFKDGKNQSAFLGTTNREVFLQRLRIGTFSNTDMPNHAFFAILTEDQISNTTGKKWLALLKECGFEFLRTVDNSVYTGDRVISAPGSFGEQSSDCGCDEDDCWCDDDNCSSHPNYIFALFRNIGTGAIADPFTPPKAWTDLPQVVPETVHSDSGGLAVAQQEAQLKCWDALPERKFYTEDELVALGVPVWLAGRRSDKPQELKQTRERNDEQKKGTTPVAKTSPFGVAPAPPFKSAFG